MTIYFCCTNEEKIQIYRKILAEEMLEFVEKDLGKKKQTKVFSTVAIVVFTPYYEYYKGLILFSYSFGL